MPVLATIATINLLFRGGTTASFLDPPTLRDRIESELTGSDARDRALSLVDELEQLTRRYDESLAASIEAYVSESTKAASRAEDLIAILGPWDHTRGETLHEIAQIRQTMLDLLTAEQWERVFG